MPTPAQKQQRAHQARINGAKSHGPTTPEGIAKARTAPLQHGLYATEASLKSTVDEARYAELLAEYQSAWSPANRYMQDKVDDLVSYRWELIRLREVRREYLARVFNDVGSVADTEAYVMAKGSILEKFDLRMRRCNMEISRIERDLVRLAKHFKNDGASHKPLRTNEVHPQPLPGCRATGVIPMENVQPTPPLTVSDPPH